MFLAGRYAKHLFPLDKHKQQVIRLAALLHDIAHGAGAHSWDRTVFSKIYPDCEKGHDGKFQNLITEFNLLEHRKRIVREVLNNEIKECGVDPEEIVAIWQQKDIISKCIINGPSGADRIDFVRRDAYFSGTTHFGTIASDRIIFGSLIKPVLQPDGSFKEYLHYDEKIMTDVIQSLLGRFSQYNQVYYHKTVTAASLLLERAISIASNSLNFVERSKDLKKFLEITDDRIISEIELLPNVPEAAKICIKRLRERDLPKVSQFFKFLQTRLFGNP
jgi:HD superfamily phosphohydrolase